MNMSKAHWSSDGNDIKLSMPIAKVDQERRVVSGFATTDAVDRQGDIVTREASLKAFQGFRKNLREMHQNIAVGKVVSFKEDKYFDEEANKFYNGVYVSAYVSKGAQDTWEKVLDGTLTGFSIGGNIKEAEDVYNEEMDKSIRVIKDYDLSELSLVDNPANQYANVISIEKNHDGGYLAKASIENVYWCSSDDLVQLSAEGSSDCPRCDKGMQNIGFVESNDAEKADVVKTILSRMKNDEKEVSKMAEENIETSEAEVVETAEEVEKTVDAPVEEDETVAKAEEETTSEDAESVEKSEETTEEAVEKSEETTEDEAVEKAEESNTEQEVLKTVADTVTSAVETLAETMKALNDKVEDLHKTISGVSQEVASVSQEVKEVKSTSEEFGKRVDAVENDTAFRKSGDLGEIVQEEPVRVQKSLWGGRFLNKSDLFN